MARCFAGQTGFTGSRVAFTNALPPFTAYSFLALGIPKDARLYAHHCKRYKTLISDFTMSTACPTAILDVSLPEELFGAAATHRSCTTSYPESGVMVSDTASCISLFLKSHVASWTHY